MAEELFNSYSLEKTSDETSGTLTIWQDTPTSPYDIGDIFTPVPGGQSLKVKKVNISDNVVGKVNGKPLRQWQVTIEGSTDTEEEQSNTNIKYTFGISSNETSGTMEVTNIGNSPSFSVDVGSNFNVPGVDNVKCTAIKGSDNYEDGVHVWTTTYEGVAVISDDPEEQGGSSLPENEISTTYEINGTTVRTVDGEFIALRRSSTPITKKTITIYNTSDSAISTPGGTYQGGIVLSENVIKETISKNDVTISSYYKHTIEVEL